MMKKLLLGMMLCCLSSAYAASLEMGTSQGTDTKISDQLDSVKSRSLGKTNTDKQAQGQEARSELSRNTTADYSQSVSQQISIGGLFFPFLVELEHYSRPRKKWKIPEFQQLIINLHDRGYLTEEDLLALKHTKLRTWPLTLTHQCRVLSGKGLVWGQYPNVMMNEKLDSETYEQAIDVFPGQHLKPRKTSHMYEWNEPAVVHITHSNTVSYTAEAASMFGAPHMPAQDIECLIIYETILEHAMRQLAQEATIATDRLSGERMLVLPNLMQKAGRAFWNAVLNNEAVQEQALTACKLFQQSPECFIPTPNGLEAGRSNVSCGSWQYDQMAKVLTYNGVRFFSENTMNGIKVSFAESFKNTESAGTRQAESAYQNTEESTTRNQELKRSESESQRQEENVTRSWLEKLHLSASPIK